MANIREVEIEGEVRWDWTRELTGEEAKSIVSWFMDDLVGIKLKVGGYGGSSLPFRISGEEAIAYEGVCYLTSIFRRLGTVRIARCRDIENGDGWVRIP